MGTGSSKSGKAGKKISTRTKAKTPSGVSYDQFMKMSDSEKYDTMDRIINDQNIKVPDYLDNSITSKVMYGLGMNNKPKVVTDAQLDAMPGKDLYRTVYDTTSPPPYAQDILNQIRTGDYTQMSGSGGSAHGRAIYFARNDFRGSASYGNRGNNAMMMRAKINQGANMMKESTLTSMMNSDSDFGKKISGQHNSTDAKALYSLSHGIDGWYADYGSYNMVVNRGALTASSTNKKTTTYQKTPTGRIKKRYGQPVTITATSWASADDA